MVTVVSWKVAPQGSVAHRRVVARWPRHRASWAPVASEHRWVVGTGCSWARWHREHRLCGGQAAVVARGRRRTAASSALAARWNRLRRGYRRQRCAEFTVDNFRERHGSARMRSLDARGGSTGDWDSPMIRRRSRPHSKLACRAATHGPPGAPEWRDHRVRMFKFCFCTSVNTDRLVAALHRRWRLLWSGARAGIGIRSGPG